MALWVPAVGFHSQPKGSLHLTGSHLTQSSSSEVLSWRARVEVRQWDSPGPHLLPVPPWALEGVKKLSLWGDAGCSQTPGGRWFLEGLFYSPFAPSVGLHKSLEDGNS